MCWQGMSLLREKFVFYTKNVEEIVSITDKKPGSFEPGLTLVLSPSVIDYDDDLRSSE
jgi:hypothetical protein